LVLRISDLPTEERRRMLDPEQLLYVYELKGGVPPPFLNLAGLLGVWPEADYTYLFFTNPAEAALESFFREHPEYRLTRRYQLPYRQWQQLTVEEPLVIDRFKIITSKKSIKLSAGEILLWIDPGVIFGSGLHPTTRGCLRTLSLLYSEATPFKVLDLGTGTGILAIAAAKLGAGQVDAVDLNPIAISTAAANCERNGVKDVVRLIRGDARNQLPEAELLCVNIHFDFLESFFRSSAVCRYRWAIVGGFLEEKLPEVRALLPSCTKIKDPVLQEKGWVTMLLEIQKEKV
jgi:ribosomal protein L11 methyltransferase